MNAAWDPQLERSSPDAALELAHQKRAALTVHAQCIPFLLGPTLNAQKLLFPCDLRGCTVLRTSKYEMERLTIHERSDLSVIDLPVKLQ